MDNMFGKVVNKEAKKVIDVENESPHKLPLVSEQTDVAPVTNPVQVAGAKPPVEPTTYTETPDRKFKVTGASGKLYGTAEKKEDAFALAYIKSSIFKEVVTITDADGKYEGEVG